MSQVEGNYPDQEIASSFLTLRGRDERQPEVTDWQTQGHEDLLLALRWTLTHGVTCAPGFSVGSGRSQSRAQSTSWLSFFPLSICLPYSPSLKSLMRNSPSQALLLDAQPETFIYVNNWMEVFYDVLNVTSINKFNIFHIFELFVFPSLWTVYSQALLMSNTA